MVCRDVMSNGRSVKRSLRVGVVEVVEERNERTWDTENGSAKKLNSDVGEVCFRGVFLQGSRCSVTVCSIGTRRERLSVIEITTHVTGNVECTTHSYYPPHSLLHDPPFAGFVPDQGEGEVRQGSKTYQRNRSWRVG